ncbi:cobalamin biosynthesis protein CbiX [Atlantibacter hermannii]|uniref:cobalamin biosynthesis protein CbiX n=1 Tax=Atlantibacter hermannii TaxID=565 RepID=UPI0028A9FA93|nr:cobalamin biosynthesis protein CbiX [Atlantibacter hermannii]
MERTVKFIRFLNKYFDAQLNSEFVPYSKEQNTAGKDVDTIWIYEKDNDCEPVLILKDAQGYTDSKEKGFWIVGNIYSSLKHGETIHEDEFRKLVKDNKVIKQ